MFYFLDRCLQDNHRFAFTALPQSKKGRTQNNMGGKGKQKTTKMNGTGKVSTMKFTVRTTSKWLSGDEKRVFCNVMESGDIIEVQNDTLHIWGIGIKTKTKDGNKIEVAYYKPSNEPNIMGKIVREPLENFWTEGSQIRINNSSDKTHQHHSEEEVVQRVEHALQHKSRKWHNSEHFAFWCRHGEKLTDKRQMSDVAKWGSLSASAGVWMFMRKRHNTQ
ncbi:uncharacterized protein LOC126440350 [Schistocerca serialis cubense]|uniref:uncharacterized protein LOC126440350 n=1 Tax=Schistocerca serialis cubense TaxID=2023355 RepID=UPI00214DFBE3|nr:uncharacterized protein LOC126440350 [Schistocerca serialis cubense]